MSSTHLMGQYPQWKVPDYVWRGMKSKIEGDIAAELSRSTPSVKRFKAGSFAVSYPPSWEAHGREDGVSLVAPGGLTYRSNGQPDISTGVMLTYVKLAREKGITLEQFTDNYLTSCCESSADYQQKIVKSTPDSLLTRVSLTSPVHNGREIITLSVHRVPDGFFAAGLVAPADQYNANLPSFKQIIESIQ
ncbi:MAG: hypothetical protein H7Y20_13105 [Bryobacteraceae bacterium]|nr:hypothetical protein [Bryobacteraceae bacterium]